MSSIAYGQSEAVYSPLAGTITVTPGDGTGRVSVRGQTRDGVEFANATITDAATFTTPAGSTLIIATTGCEATYSATVSLQAADGGVVALSEAVAVVPLTATGSGAATACEFRGFVVRSESGGTADVTIYDALSATGTAIMTVANVSVGTYYWDGDWSTPGVGNGGRRINSTGCWVVIAGTCTIDVMVE